MYDDLLSVGRLFDQELGRFPDSKVNISHDDVCKLFGEYKKGNSLSGQKIINAHLRVLMKVAINFAKRTGIDHTELLSIGYDGFFEALDHYDPNRGQFYNCAYEWIRSSISTWLDRERRIQKRYISSSVPFGEGLELGDRLEDRTNDGIEVFENEQALLRFREVAMPFFDDLSEKRAKFLVVNRILSEEPMTLQEIADEFGVTREAICQQEFSIRNRLKGRLFKEGYFKSDLI